MWFIRSMAAALIFLVLVSEASLAEVPQDLAEAARFQLKNKGMLLQKMQQKAAFARKQGNAEVAKQITAEIEAVRANKVLVLPALGEASEQIGAIEIEQILEREEGGVRVLTMLPRYENTGVSANTGRRVKSETAFAMGGEIGRAHV